LHTSWRGRHGTEKKNEKKAERTVGNSAVLHHSQSAGGEECGSYISITWGVKGEDHRPMRKSKEREKEVPEGSIVKVTVINTSGSSLRRKGNLII